LQKCCSPFTNNPRTTSKESAVQNCSVSGSIGLHENLECKASLKIKNYPLLRSSRMLHRVNALEIRSADDEFSIPTENQAVILHLNEDFDIDSKICCYLLYKFLIFNAHGPTCHFWLLPATILECPCSG